MKVRGTAATPPTTESKFITLFISFDDTRHAHSAKAEIDMVNYNWNAVYISQTEYTSGKKASLANGIQEVTSFHDGQVLFVAQFGGLSSDFSVDGLFDAVYAMAVSFGEVLGFREMESEAGNWNFRAEYYKISEAKTVINSITKAHPAGSGVSPSPCLPSRDPVTDQ